VNEKSARGGPGAGEPGSPRVAAEPGRSEPEAARVVAELEGVIGHVFRTPALAEMALRHASFSHETLALPDNERLEFLGDAVLGLVVAESLYREYPDWSEGELTRARAALVNRANLAHCARELGLGGMVRLGRTEHRSGGQGKDTILANCFEAVLGAVYLDGGIEPAVALARRALGPAGEAPRDPKTAFQEWAHAHRRATPTYRTARDSGIEDDEARFTVEVRVGDETWGAGTGRSKRVAERLAAVQALARSAERDG
jgi:ribonuclease-3